MLATNSGYWCRNRFAGNSRNTATTGNLGTYLPRSKFLPRTFARLKTLPGISGYADPGCVVRMKRLKNKKTNESPKMDLSKKKSADYTELAYREAISKLKYLLAESYAPIGMPGTTPRSLRNIYKTSNSRINESGEDTDDQSMISDNFRKKDLAGNTASNIFAPFSKTIHSTKAYSNIALSKPDLHTFPPELSSFIERQEDYIEQLERESQYCRNELINLLSKVREVVAENEVLHKRNQTVLSKCSLQDHKDFTEANHECHKQDTTNHTDNFESKREKPLEGPSIIFESRISELEAQLTQTKLELRKAQEENQANLKRLSESCSNEGSPEMKAELDKALRAKYEAEMKLEEAHKLLSAARDKETEATHKARRSMDDRHQLEFERNQSETEIKRLKDELERQHEKLRETAQEANRRITEERQQVERRYNQQIEQLSAEIASHWETSNKSQLESEKQRRELNDLRRELSQKQTSIDNLKKELQNKISLLQSDLNQTLSEKDAAEQEVLNGKLTAERCERQARQEQNRLQTEINSYKQRLERADADLVHCRRENLRLSEQIASLEKEINLSKITRSEESRSQITPRLENEKELTSMIMDMETKHEGVVERDATTVGQTASSSNKKRTVKVDLKVKVIPKKKSDSSKMSLSAQKEMAELQSNVEHLSNKIQDTFTGHEESPMETNDGTSTAFQYNATMETVNPSFANALPVNENNTQIIHQGYNVAPDQQITEEGIGMYSNVPENEQESRDLYDLSNNQTYATENNTMPNMMENTEMYTEQREGRNEGEYIPGDQNAYMAEQEYDQYGGYNPSQYEEDQFVNDQQFNSVITEQIDNNQTVSDVPRSDSGTLH